MTAPVAVARLDIHLAENTAAKAADERRFLKLGYGGGVAVSLLRYGLRGKGAAKLRVLHGGQDPAVESEAAVKYAVDLKSGVKLSEPFDCIHYCMPPLSMKSSITSSPAALSSRSWL